MLGNKKIRVVVTDDSAFMRRMIKNVLEKDPRVEVVAVAGNGKEFLEKAAEHRPDVATMDLEMPVMNGLEALREIMFSDNPMPVIMLSSLTGEGAEQTILSLELGAFDYILKPSGANDAVLFEKGLASRVRAAYEYGFKMKKGAGKGKSSCPGKGTGNGTEKVFPLVFCPGIFAISSSTGGPTALLEVLKKIPADFPVPAVVAQHITKGFSRPLAQRLDRSCELSVREATDGEVLLPGTVYLAPAGCQMEFLESGAGVKIKITEEKRFFTRYSPSADIMFASLQEIYGGDVIAAILTGMGSDGTEGLKAIHASGGYVIAQDEESCVVYGMPKSAAEAGVVTEILPVDRIGSAVADIVKRTRKK